jgi:hypothetical protein
VYGQSGTVSSQGGKLGVQIPSSVSIRSAKYAGAKKFKLFEVPPSGAGLEDTCFSLIGQGTLFCVATNCKTSHRGRVISPAPGDLFVADLPTRVYADPKTFITFLSPDLLVDWNVSSYALEEWSRLFMLVNNSMAEGPTSIAKLELKEDFATKAEAHCTPGKRKAEGGLPPLSLRASPYLRQINFTSDDETPFSLSSNEALEVLKQLDEGLEKSTTGLLELSEEHGLWSR